MSFYTEVAPVGYVLAFLLAGVWLLLWRASRRARFWYAGLAPILAVLCWPLAIVAAPYGPRSLCLHQQTCAGDASFLIVINGVLALPVALLLGVLTLLLEAGRSLLLRLRSSRP